MEQEEWSEAKICIHCELPKRLHMGRKHHCAKGEATYESKANVRLVRHVDRGILGQEEPQLVPLPITDDRNENPDYAAWRDI
jgi:hypothetical protein